jgi:hypothetical protein
MCGWRKKCSSPCITSSSPKWISCGSISGSTKPKRSRFWTGPALFSSKSGCGYEAAISAAGSYELALKCSHLFNLLDARGAVSVTERVGVIARIRALAVGVAKAYALQQAA